jgi:hypothetical protein
LRLVPLRTGHAVAIFTYRGRCIFICMQGGRGSGKGWGEGAFAVGRVRGKAASRKRPTTRRSGRPPARMHATSCYSAFPRPRGEEAGRGGGRGRGGRPETRHRNYDFVRERPLNSRARC